MTGSVTRPRVSILIIPITITGNATVVKAGIVNTPQVRDTAVLTDTPIITMDNATTVLLIIPITTMGSVGISNTMRKKQ